jgi:hypothetical protein
MAARRPDPEILRAIRIHTGTHHGRGISADQIARERKGRRAVVTRVTYVPETPESPAWIICHDCPEGAQRYRVDVFAGPTRPPARHVEAIRRHMAAAHGLTRFSARRIYRQRSSRALVTYLPTRPLVGAQMICALCPEGRNHLILEEPPYGDARSFWELRLQHPELASQMYGLTPAERADAWEAVHRGISATATQPAITRALRRARQGTPARRLTETQQGIQRLLGAEVRAGAPITNVIDELAVMARSDPGAYAVRIARHIPSMRDDLSQPPEVIAKTLVDFCGTPPTSSRALWALWAAIQKDPHQDT